MEIKSWYKSKTIWVNVLAFLLATITYLEGADILPDHVLKALLSVVFPVVNIALRFLTNKPILKQQEELAQSLGGGHQDPVDKD